MDGDSAPISLNDGSSETHPTFRMEGWTVRPRAHELVRSGETIHLEPRPMAVLVFLATRAGETVSRDELMAGVWPGVFVSEHALNRCVSKLRKLFDDDARSPRVIETIPKSGYRLVSPVEWLRGNGDGTAFDVLDLRVTNAPASSQTARHGKRSRIVFLSFAVGIGAIAATAFAVRMQPSSPNSQTLPLTTAPGTETQAAWSPDGTRLVYVHQDGEGAQRLYLYVLGGDEPLRLTDGPRDLSPVWSPDGASIAFVRCDSLACKVFAVPSPGGQVRQLDDGMVSAQGLDFSADGRVLVVSAPDSTGRNYAITLLNIETGIRQRLTDPPEDVGESSPIFSPDGQWIVFRRSNRAGADLYRIPAAGGQVERLTQDYRPQAGHTWTADGRAIIFSSARTGVYALWRVPVEGGTPEIVSGPAVRDPGGPVVAELGQRLVVEDWLFEINLWELEEGAEPVRRVASTLWDKQPHLSPDGSRIAFVSNRTGFTEIWTAMRDGSDLVRLTDFEGMSVEHPRISPDGQRIVFQAWTTEGADLFLINAVGGAPRRLTSHPDHEVAPRWSRDGRTVFFGSNRHGDWSVWRMFVEGGEAVRVAEGYTGEEAADGALITTRYRAPGLWRTAEGETQQIAQFPALGDWGAWAITNQAVILLERRLEGNFLISLNPVTGATSPLSLTVGELTSNEPNLTASANGRSLFVAQVDRVEADLLLVEPFE